MSMSHDHLSYCVFKICQEQVRRESLYTHESSKIYYSGSTEFQVLTSILFIIIDHYLNLHRNTQEQSHMTKRRIQRVLYFTSVQGSQATQAHYFFHQVPITAP